MKKQELWWENAIIYELYVDKFAGNFNELTTKLDYLKNLGVTCIHLLPFYNSPMVDDGYDITDFKSIKKDLGTLEDFDKFTKKAHKIDIKIIIDLVLNHTSTLHPWFKDATQNKDSDKKRYYLWSKDGKGFNLAPNPFSNIKDSNWIYNETLKEYYYATYYPEQADLNWDNPKVVKEMFSIIDFWLDHKVDGFRLDAISHLVKRENTTCVGLKETHEIVKKIRKHIDQKYHNRVLLAEADEKIEEAQKYFGKGDECQLVYNFELSPKLWLALKNNKDKVNHEFLSKTKKIPNGCSWVSFLRNHDSLSLSLANTKEKKELTMWLDPEIKFSSKLGSKISMRVGEILQGNKEEIIKAHELLMKREGAIVLYYGEEIGMKNQILNKKLSDPRIFVRGTFDWDEANKQQLDNNSIFNSVKYYIANRNRKNKSITV